MDQVQESEEYNIWPQNPPIQKLFMDNLHFCRKNSKYALPMKHIPYETFIKFVESPNEKNLKDILKLNQKVAGQIRREPGQKADRYQSLNVISRPDGQPDFCVQNINSQVECAYGNNKIKGNPKTKPYPVHIEFRGHDDIFKNIKSLVNTPNSNVDWWASDDVSKLSDHLYTYVKNVIALMNMAKNLVSETKTNYQETWKHDETQRQEEINNIVNTNNDENIQTDNMDTGCCIS